MAEVRTDPERLRRERDLYLRLLELGGQEQIEPFLADALALVVEATGARRGYLELRAEGEGAEDPVWWMAQGYSREDVEGIRHAISRGIIGEAIATGKTVTTPAAFLDPRFDARESVRARRIEAVLCAPVGAEGPIGVVYLEGCDAGAWSDENLQLAELFARHLTPLADRLLVRRRERERDDPTRSLRESLHLDDVVGRSAALARVLRQVALVAPLDVSVLLTGDSGTGKSQIAQVIHRNGPRAAGPFVELNCAALPETLIENELFGAREGAHSTARTAVPGKVAAAEGGTLLLDEVSELPPTAQAKLLQLLQSKLYYPLGATQPERANVRLIAATNADLDGAVADKRFREDLYYRLQVLPIRLPTLAERREDVPELVAHFAAQACERHGLPELELSGGAVRAIEAAEWPGNVRQLAHALEAAAIRAAGEGARRIERRHVFPESTEAEPGETEPATFQEATRRFQMEHLRRTLAETGWNVAETARRLDLARSHVYNLIRAFGLERER